MTNDPFWAKTKSQLAELRTAGSAADVLRILSPENNPYRIDNPNWDGQDPGADGFFAGSGSDDTVWEALADAGWEMVWGNAIYYAMRAPDGSVITYCEGDVYGRDKRAAAPEDDRHTPDGCKDSCPLAVDHDGPCP